MKSLMQFLQYPHIGTYWSSKNTHRVYQYREQCTNGDLRLSWGGNNIYVPLYILHQEFNEVRSYEMSE